MGAAENRLVTRRSRPLKDPDGRLARRVRRGEGGPLPSLWRGVFAAGEIACLWQLPSCEYSIVPVLRGSVPVAPAPPGVHRPSGGLGSLRDEYGPVSIECSLRKQNTAVPGTVEQGKTSYLVATVAEDLERERCAVILFDPKGDAADAAVSLVEPSRTCTVLDLARPTCGFNPLEVDAPADVIADYVVGALKNLFSDADIRASSDRYLRNAVIAVLAYDRRSTLWDAARLLSVGEEGYAFRKRVAAAVRTLPEFSEISAFFTAEIGAQLADARSMTTSKLDAPVNKLARLLNSPSIKRVLLNESLRVDFDRVIAGAEVLVVKGALGAMGAGNTSVLMQLLVGMLDAALARQQDLVASEQRVAVALKVDEAPLVLNRGFAETMALKRSAGLETVACWQTDAQWSDPAIRDQLDALFAHRVYFATASVSDARSAASLTMSEFSDTVRPGIGGLSALGRPGRAPAPAQAPRDRQLEHYRWPPGGLRRTHDPAAGGPVADRATRRAPARPRRQTPRRPAPPALGSAGTRAPDFRAVETRCVRSAAHRAPVRASVRRAGGDQLPRAGRDRPRAQREMGAPWRAARAGFEPEPLDLEMLGLMCELGHLLSSQIHRWFNPDRAPTTTQRRLKRLSDAGLVDRLQFHRRDGGGAPMCYRVSTAGTGAAGARSTAPATGSTPTRTEGEPAPRRESSTRISELRGVRRDVHVAAWALSAMRSLKLETADVGGRSSSSTEPAGPAERGPGSTAPTSCDCRAAGCRTSSSPAAAARASEGRSEVEQFETVRPDAVVQGRRGRHLHRARRPGAARRPTPPSSSGTTTSSPAGHCTPSATEPVVRPHRRSCSCAGIEPGPGSVRGPPITC